LNAFSSRRAHAAIRLLGLIVGACLVAAVVAVVGFVGFLVRLGA
jgi:hypothetical protein